MSFDCRLTSRQISSEHFARFTTRTEVPSSLPVHFRGESGVPNGFRQVIETKICPNGFQMRSLRLSHSLFPCQSLEGAELLWLLSSALLETIACVRCACVCGIDPQNKYEQHPSILPFPCCVHATSALDLTACDASLSTQSSELGPGSERYYKSLTRVQPHGNSRGQNIVCIPWRESALPGRARTQVQCQSPRKTLLKEGREWSRAPFSTRRWQNSRILGSTSCLLNSRYCNMGHAASYHQQVSLPAFSSRVLSITMMFYFCIIALAQFLYIVFVCFI